MHSSSHSEPARVRSVNKLLEKHTLRATKGPPSVTEPVALAVTPTVIAVDGLLAKTLQARGELGDKASFHLSLTFLGCVSFIRPCRSLGQGLCQLWTGSHQRRCSADRIVSAINR